MPDPIVAGLGRLPLGSDENRCFRDQACKLPDGRIKIVTTDQGNGADCQAGKKPERVADWLANVAAGVAMLLPAYLAIGFVDTVGMIPTRSTSRECKILSSFYRKNRVQTRNFRVSAELIEK